jgi:hypothetical protein
MPLCYTPEQRLFFQQLILDRIVAIWPTSEPTSSEKIIAKCLDRLRFERDTHLLSQEELPTILQELKCQADSRLLEPSRMRRVIYRVRKRSQMARIFYPRIQNAESYLSSPRLTRRVNEQNELVGRRPPICWSPQPAVACTRALIGIILVCERLGSWFLFVSAWEVGSSQSILSCFT